MNRNTSSTATRIGRLLLALSVAIAGAAHAQIEPIGPFTKSPVRTTARDEVTFTGTSSDWKSDDPEVSAMGFTWDPESPEINELVGFAIHQVPGTISVARWTFDEPGCGGFPIVYTCTPLFTDCLTYGHKFATSGEHTVTLEVTVGSTNFPPIERIVTVLDEGSCGGGCTYSINPTTAGYPATMSSGVVWVTTQAACPWQATTDDAWITVSSGASGTGSGTFSYSVAPNCSASRAGSILVANRSHTVTQLGRNCPPEVEGVWERTLSNGGGVPSRVSASAMTVFNSKIYVGTKNDTGGFEVLRSSDGRTWQLVASGGLGDVGNTEVTAFQTFSSWLFLATVNADTGCEIWRTSDGASWSLASSDGFGMASNTSAPAMTVFAGGLHVGTRNDTTGAQVWRTSDGLSWTQVNLAGFGSAHNDTATALLEFDSSLHAASTGFWGFRLFRRADGTTWNQIGLDGFGDNANAEVTALADIRGLFHVGTANLLTGGEYWTSSDGFSWTQELQDGFDGQTVTQQVSFVVEHLDRVVVGLSNPQTGGIVWTDNGRDGPDRAWAAINDPGFGNQYSVDLPSAVVFNGMLTVGTENPHGFEVWRLNPNLLFADGFESGAITSWNSANVD